MILNKRLVVLLNVVHFEIKHYFSEYMLGQGFDITPEQFLLLDSLWDKEEGLSQQEAANLIMKDKNSITRLVDALENKGYVQRTKGEGDRRVNRIVLTPYARNISEEIQKVAEKAIENVVDGLGDEKLECLVRSMLKIHDNIDRFSKGSAYKLTLE